MHVAYSNRAIDGKLVVIHINLKRTTQCKQILALHLKWCSNFECCVLNFHLIPFLNTVGYHDTLFTSLYVVNL